MASSVNSVEYDVTAKSKESERVRLELHTSTELVNKQHAVTTSLPVVNLNM